jgi:hypothetical protein
MGEYELSFVDKLDDRAESWTSVEAESWMRVEVVESSRLFCGGFRVDWGEALRYGYKYSIQFCIAVQSVVYEWRAKGYFKSATGGKGKSDTGRSQKFRDSSPDKDVIHVKRNKKKLK